LNFQLARANWNSVEEFPEPAQKDHPNETAAQEDENG